MIGNAERPMMVCPKEGCRFTFCFNCKEEWHADSTCAQYQQWKIDNANSDSSYAQWAAANTKACPKCHAAIEKNGGCNHVCTCVCVCVCV